VVEVQVGVVHVEVAAADLGQLAVDLDAVDPRLGEELLVGTRGRAGRVAQDGDAPGGFVERREWQHEVAVPDVAREHAVRLVDRMLRLAFVQLERAAAVVALDDARVLILGLGLVDDLAVVARLERPYG
jgi:hypothetical protein